MLNNTKLRHFWAQIVSWAPRHARKTFIVLVPGQVDFLWSISRYVLIYRLRYNNGHVGNIYGGIATREKSSNAATFKGCVSFTFGSVTRLCLMIWRTQLTMQSWHRSIANINDPLINIVRTWCLSTVSAAGTTTSSNESRTVANQ